VSAAAAAILPVVPLPPLAVADVRLAETLQLVADTIVESLGFDVAVINLVDDDVQSMVVAAVSGPDEVREALLNRRQGLKGWAELVAASEPWGRLRFLDHNTTVADPADILTWIPDLPVSDDPNAWHPEDALFAPLESSDGRPLGMLSVDVPRDGMRPAPAIRHALEAFVVTAALAIQHATLAADARRAAARFQAVFDASPIPVALLGPDKCFSSLNDAFCRFLGRSRDELVGLDPLDLTHPDDKAATVALSLDVRSAGSAAVGGPIEKRYVLPDGSIAWARLHLAALGSDLDPGFLIAQLEDITERRHAEERLLKQAHFDSLTGLPNRSQSMRKLRAALRAAEHDETTAVFFCDLDRLKLVNDAHGHAVGDSYIRAVSARIRATVRGGDTVGRLSGDEFVVVLPGLRSPSEAVRLAARVIESVRQPMRVGGVVFSPSLSLGIAYRSGSAQSAESADELLAQADSAMYHAKTQHRGSWHIFDQSLKTSAVAQLQLRTDISSALRHDEFVLHYQPIVRLSDGVTVAREALLRWQHPRRGLLTPAEFLDVVVDSEYETAVTEWAVRRACLDAAARPSGPRRVHVNISSVQIGRADLIEHVLACLSESGLEPNDLVLELTEDRLLSRPDAHELVERLRSLGVSLAIDDFGTGYAGLQYLRRFATLDIVKLDRSFVADIGQGGISEHIIRAMIDVARSSGLTLVTEGVETQQQADFLRAAGAEYAQGYHFGGPEPAPAVC
jgi:diguanylate cyclase (GGDEF)-like protein/PAS domain S-box-containing protein